MNKKCLVIMFAAILLFSSFAFASAKAADLNSDGKISFFEWLKGIFTGKVTESQILIQGACTDSDGNNINVKGSVTTSTQSYTDDCISGSSVREYLCGGKGAYYTDSACPSGQTCQSGACKNVISGTGPAPDVSVGTACIDLDGDGASPSRGCTPFDCDDNDAEKFTGNTEICGDNKDNDCNNAVDEATCKEKACLEFADSGNNLLIADVNAGESCISSDVVKEVFCDSAGKIIQSAPYSCTQYAGAGTFCSGGACSFCVDTDKPGANYTFAGESFNLTYINSPKKDYCVSNKILNESACSANSVGNRVNYQAYDCSNLGSAYACKEGACACTPNYVLFDCDKTKDIAVFRDASQCRAEDYSVRYDCDGNGLISTPLCSPDLSNAVIGIDELLFDPSLNYSKSTRLIQIATEQTGSGTDFEWDFSEPFNFCDIEIESSEPDDDFGYLIFNSSEENLNKTIFVDKLTNSKKVCIKDAPGIESINELSANCTGAGETLISCPGKNSTYNCQIVSEGNFSWFKVWPLNHSAAREIPGTTACAANWTCASWSDAANQCGTRNCTDANNCGTTSGKPPESQQCLNGSFSQGLSCVPDWICTDFGKCSEGVLKRTCTDANNCGTDEGKPGETSSCTGGQSKKVFIIALIILGILLIALLIWYLLRKSKRAGEEEHYSKPTHAPSPPHRPPTQGTHAPMLAHK